MKTILASWIVGLLLAVIIVTSAIMALVELILGNHASGALFLGSLAATTYLGLRWLGWVGLRWWHKVKANVPPY